MGPNRAWHGKHLCSRFANALPCPSSPAPAPLHPRSLNPRPRRGTWRTQEFKDYNFNALGVLPAGGHLHPLLKVRGCERATMCLHKTNGTATMCTGGVTGSGGVWEQGCGRVGAGAGALGAGRRAAGAFMSPRAGCRSAWRQTCTINSCSVTRWGLPL